MEEKPKKPAETELKPKKPPVAEIQYVSPPKGDARHQNAAGKKMCGMCEFRNRAVAAGNIWRCLKGLECPWPEPENPCINYFHRTQKIKPPKKGELPRLTIPPGTRFIYFGRPGPGVMTVAYSICEKVHLVEIGFSFCSPKDPWVKSFGQQLAIDRLLKIPITAPYLYEPKRLVLQISQALMERRISEISEMATIDGLKMSVSVWEQRVPGWSKDLAQRLKVQTWTCLMPRNTKVNRLRDMFVMLGPGLTAATILARMKRDLENLEDQ